MTVPETVLLHAQQAQLLLYSMGYRKAYGFLPAELPDRQQTLQFFADLVRKGILQEQNGNLVLQSPWKDCLRHWGEAGLALRLHTVDTGSPDCCCYPYAEGVVVCIPQPRRPQMLRLFSLPKAELWNWMSEYYQLPAEAEGTLDCEREGQEDATLADAWQSGTDPERLPGFLFFLEAFTWDATPPRRLAAVQRPLYRQLLLRHGEQVFPLPYREAEIRRCLREWLGAKEEDAT